MSAKTNSSVVVVEADVGLSRAWRALRHRNFRLFFGGQSISLIGTWMTRLATSWLVYRLTGSAFLLGIVGFAGQIPTFLLAPFAGVWVDRLNRRHVLIVTQILAMLQSLALAVLTLTKHITIHEIIWLSMFQGMINAFDMPGRQAFLVEMVEDRQDLGNAIALNSSMVNMARLVGPSLAGMVIAVSGEGACFLVDGISYLAVIASLLAMRLKPAALKRVTASMWAQLREGWDYVAGFRADTDDTHFVRVGELDGLAVHGADAGICFDDFERWSAHVGIPDGRRGSWRAGFGVIVGDTQERAGAGAHDLYCDRDVWSGADFLRTVEEFLAFACVHAFLRLWNDAADGGEQHHHSNDCG